MANNPITWSTIYGHAPQKQLLEHSVAQNKIHHALLFSGTDGVGKYLIGTEFSKALNCLNRTEGRWAIGCDNCSSCQRFNHKTNPDYMEVKPDGRFVRIEQIRNVVQFCQSGPFDSRYKIVLIESVHFMNRESANALLKTLEEPSKNVILILLTDCPDALLETILSRCQHIRFGALSLEEVTSIISNVDIPLPSPTTSKSRSSNGQNKNTLNPSSHDIQIAARLSSGSPGHAIRILQSNIIHIRKDLFQSILELSPSDYNRATQLAETYSQGGRETVKPILELLRSLFRDLAILNVTHDHTRIIHIDFIENLRYFSGRFTPLKAAECTEKINELLLMLDQNVNAQLVIEELIRHIQLIQPPSKDNHSKQLPHQ